MAERTRGSTVLPVAGDRPTDRRLDSGGGGRDGGRDACVLYDGGALSHGHAHRRAGEGVAGPGHERERTVCLACLERDEHRVLGPRRAACRAVDGAHHDAGPVMIDRHSPAGVVGVVGVVPRSPVTSTITCPACGGKATELMPTDACRYVYICGHCGVTLRPRPQGNRILILRALVPQKRCVYALVVRLMRQEQPRGY